jgi:carbamoyltransferase
MRSSDRQPAVLGLCSFTHDSAAALITGGRLTGMAEEERLSGVKHTRAYPAAAVQWLLDDAGLAAAIDIVAYNFAGHRYLTGIAGAPGHLLRAATRSRALPRAASFAVIHHRFRACNQGSPAGRPHSPAPGANVRILRRNRLGGMIREYPQVA